MNQTGANCTRLPLEESQRNLEICAFNIISKRVELLAAVSKVKFASVSDLFGAFFVHYGWPGLARPTPPSN